MNIDHNFLKKLRMLSLIEGCSTLLLFFVAMPLKYMAGIPEAVKVVGMAHGVLFLLVVAAFIYAIERIPLDAKLALLGCVAAVIPFGPFVFDTKLKKLA